MHSCLQRGSVLGQSMNVVIKSLACLQGAP